jgi:hypothetical protein
MLNPKSTNIETQTENIICYPSANHPDPLCERKSQRGRCGDHLFKREIKNNTPWTCRSWINQRCAISSLKLLWRILKESPLEGVVALRVVSAHYWELADDRLKRHTEHLLLECRLFLGRKNRGRQERLREYLLDEVWRFDSLIQDLGTCFTLPWCLQMFNRHPISLNNPHHWKGIASDRYGNKGDKHIHRITLSKKTWYYRDSPTSSLNKY